MKEEQRKIVGLERSGGKRLVVKLGLSSSDKPMTYRQAWRMGYRLMDRALRRAGFEVFVAESDPELHGGSWFRISYGKRC